MPQDGQIFRVLVASPSDCKQERRAVPEVISAWNATNSLRRAQIIEPVLWETHSTPALGDRPQAILNKQLIDRCDFLIATFWTRIGSPTGEAESGTVEEIERFRKAKKPVLLYFSEVPVVPSNLDKKQFEALKNFRERLEPEGLVRTYENVGHFREMLVGHLTTTIDQLAGFKTPAEKPDDTIPKPDNQIESIKTFKRQFDLFLRRYEAEWSSERDSEPIGVDEAKFIISSARGDVLDFLSMIAHDEETDSLETLRDVAMKMRKLENKEMYLDGGASWRSFWAEGDKIIEQLKSVSKQFGEVIKKAELNN